MRIAFFVQYNHQVGTYFRWHNMAKALQILGHEVDIYAGDHNWKQTVRLELRDGISYSIIPAFPTVRVFYAPNDFFSAFRWLFHIPKKEYDIYHLYQPFLHASVLWNKLRVQKKNAVFVFDWDDLWTGGLFQKPKDIRTRYMMWVTRWLESILPNKAAGITVCSQFLQARLPINKKSKIIHNGFWPKQTPNKNSLRLKWGLHDDIIYLAYIGKTADELDWVIDAHAYVQNKFSKKVHLCVAGPPKDYVYHLINDIGSITSSTIHYYGNLSVTDAADLAAAVDLGLIPLDNNAFNQSRFPVKFLDFLSVGTPVYLSKVGEIGEIGSNLSGVFLGTPSKLEWVNGLLPVLEAIFSGKVVNVNVDQLNELTWVALAEKQAAFYKELQIAH